MLVNRLSMDTRYINTSIRKKGRVTRGRQKHGERKKIAKKKERLRHREKINLEEVCSGNSCSVVVGEGKKMIHIKEGA